jgi:hypothetical protein
MTDPSTAPAAAPPLSLPARFVGVLLSPRETFAQVAAAPRWLGMLLVIVLILSGATFVFLSTEVGRQATLEQQVSTMESFGMTVTDEMYAQLERGLPRARYIALASQLVGLPLFYLVVAGVLFAVFSAGFGGEARFQQVFAVVVHSGAVSVVQQAFVLPLNYVRESTSSPTNLAALVPMVPEGTFLAHVLGVIDLFVIWWVVVAAVGLAVLYRRRTMPVAVSLLAVYGVIALAVGLVRSWLGGSAS